jgi:hypothetical protein
MCLTESFELVKPLGAISNFVTPITTGVRDRRADLKENVGASAPIIVHQAFGTAGVRAVSGTGGSKPLHATRGLEAGIGL